MIFKIIFILGLVLLGPGLAAMGYSLWNGPSAWLTDARTFWGTPISLFVFWIGMAHAGTLLSAIFLALGIRLDRRTSMLAELGTLCALVVAAFYPLVHLGLPENFYMVAPLLDGRGLFANLRSPLVWDFCAIAIYGILSVLYFGIHIHKEKFPVLANYRKPLAWLLFPLVFWVHTIVSLDFATTFVPEWQGAFFPLYFILGAILSGLAMVIAFLTAEGCRIRRLEEFMILCTLGLLLFWLWNFALKGDFMVSPFVFAVVLPQFWWVRAVRENPWGRVLISLSVLLGLWLERYYLVLPSLGNSETSSFGLMDWGMFAFGLGLFLTGFSFLRFKLRRFFQGDSIEMGELKISFDQALVDSSNLKCLGIPLLVGVGIASGFLAWGYFQQVNDYAQVSWLSLVPIFYPIVALVAALVLCGKSLWNIMNSRARTIFVVVALLAGFGLGAFFGGGHSTPSGAEFSVQEPSDRPMSLSRVEDLWQSRCSSCHGADGIHFNEKFIREFYPVPQKLDAARMDSLGLDSLIQVILKGRNNMNPYEGRISKEEARQLVYWMRFLSGGEPWAR